MSDTILDAEGVTVRLGGRTILADLDLALRPGERVALIGPNGAGKTTLVNVLSGVVGAHRGRVRLAGRDVTGLGPAARARAGLSRTFQVTDLFVDLSAREALRLACLSDAGLGAGTLRKADGFAPVEAKAAALLKALGVLDAADQPLGALPYGTRRMVDLALALALSPPVLVLDEPAAGAAASTLNAIAAAIDGLDRHVALLLVEHNLDFAFARTSRVVVLAQGRILADGPRADIAADPAVQAAYLGHG